MKTRILMVCLGNICRSPLAEGILKSKVSSSNYFVDSAGTAGYHVGDAPDSRSIAVAKKHNIDISKQRCRKFVKNDFHQFDVIYAMDKSNYNNIVSLAENKADIKKVKLLLSVLDTPNNEVPDPYYGGDDGFQNVFDMIDIACNEITINLNNH